MVDEKSKFFIGVYTLVRWRKFIVPFRENIIPDLCGGIGRFKKEYIIDC